MLLFLKFKTIVKSLLDGCSNVRVNITFQASGELS